MLRGELERACDALDATSADRTFATLRERYALPAWADEVPAALDLLRMLDAMAPREVLVHARAVDGRALGRRVRLAALRRAMRRVLETEGPAATTSDGSPVAGLALLLNDAELATTLLADACDASPLNVSWWVSLAKNAARDEVAVRAWCRALLLDPVLTDEALSESTLVAQLLDEADELDDPTRWLCVLADLKNVVLLDDFVFAVPETHVVHGVARALRAFRVDRAGLSESARLERKRALLRACPELKELWRAL